MEGYITYNGKKMTVKQMNRRKKLRRILLFWK